jgi:DNA-binding beta-propeller fold protein YncE
MSTRNDPGKRPQLSRRRRLLSSSASAAAALFLSVVPTGAALHAQTPATPSFLEFESGLVRPLAISPDHTKLFATNTPNGTLEIFNITPSGLTPFARVPVGMEPVAVAVRSNTEVWVVNNLSDSVSVVTLTGTPHVTNTLIVGDEPHDIVFAGSPSQAFITTAHRGQQRTDPSIASVPGAGDPQLTTPSVPRADVWVFNPANLGTTMGGTPVKIMSFFTDTPRALTVSPDGNTVYVAGFKTGNQTTAVNAERLCPTFNPAKTCKLDDGETAIGGHLPPATDSIGETAPQIAQIVQYNNTAKHWLDPAGRIFDSNVYFSLPDTDVFAVNANTLQQTSSFAHVGTTLFNMATNPVNGHVYVSNSDSHNLTRFEGPGVFGGSTVQGHLAEMDITVLNGSTVTPLHLNKHINYSILATNPLFDTTAASHSLSTPTDMQVSSDGSTLYVAAFGSSEIGVFNTTELENNTFNPVTESSNYIPVTGGGPAGLILDEARGQLYVLTRFDDSVKVVNLSTKSQTQAVALPNPEPASVLQGRPYLYSASLSGNGEASCASCHIFGDKDELAWDLGNPDNAVTTSPLSINLGVTTNIGIALFGTPGSINGTGKLQTFHPMKGPQVTQTLRGLVNDGAMHWRGDRSNGPEGYSATDPNVSFNNFIVAFQSLLGAANAPTIQQMQTFTNFQLQVVLPPNPVRALDNSLTTAQQAGKDFFGGSQPVDGINLGPITGLLGQLNFTCNGCHVLNPALGQFGTGTNASFEGIDQIFKIPHLRNMYDKVGMFGMAPTHFFHDSTDGPQGPQVRGFGFTNEGSIDTMDRFFHALVFNQPELNTGFPALNPEPTRRNVEQFMLAFDSDLAPIVGQQVTVSSANFAGAIPRVQLLQQRAGTSFTSKVLGGTVTECDLVATFAYQGTPYRVLYSPQTGLFTAYQNGSPLFSLQYVQLMAISQTAGQEVTFTAVPPGSGLRIATSS